MDYLSCMIRTRTTFTFFFSNVINTNKPLLQRQDEYNSMGITFTEHATSIAICLQLPVMLIFVHDDYQDRMHIERLSEWSCNMFNYGKRTCNMCIKNKTTQHSLVLFFNKKGGINQVYLKETNLAVGHGFKDDIGGLYTAKLTLIPGRNSETYTSIEALRASSTYTTVYAIYRGMVGTEY